MAVNPYAQYQWRDDPARKITSTMTAPSGPAYSAQSVAQGAQPTKSDAVTGPSQANPWAVSGGQQAKPFVVPGAQPSHGSFSSMLANAKPPREQNMAAANATISQLLTPQAGPSAEGQRALSDLDKQQAEQTRQIKEQSALSGRMATGQSAGDTLRLSERMMANRADAAGQIAAADAERAAQRQQQGLSGFLSMESLGQQAQSVEAQQRLAEAQMAQNAYQFQSQQDFQKWATQEGWNQDEISRAWQSMEAEKGRSFQAGQSDLDRALSSKQFQSQQDFQKWGIEQGYAQDEINRAWQANEAQKSRTFQGQESAAERASRETLAYASLSQQDKALAQESKQFNSRLEFDKWATQAGLDEKTADRIWQANESAKGRSFEEKILSLQQQFQSGESALDRALQSTQFNEKLGLDKAQLGETIRQFNSKLDFDKWATQSGLDQQTADRIWKSSESDKQRAYDSGERQLDRALESSQFAQTYGLQKEQLAENVRQFDSRQSFDTWAKKLDISQAEADKIWQAQQNDIQRKWQSGERLSGQEHEVLIESLQEKADLAKMERNQVLNLQTLEQQNKYETGLEALRQNYETSRLTQGFSHEEAMAQMQADLQSQLSAQGFSQDQAMQASRIEAEKIEAERDRAFQDKLQTARLLQENDQFFANFGLDQQRVEDQSKQIMAQISESATRLGMDQTQFQKAMENQDFAKNLETASILTEQFGDSPEMLEKATDLIWEGLYKGGLVSKEEYDTGKLMSKASSFSGAAAFTNYALSQGVDQGTIDAVVGELSQDGQWNAGKATGTATGTKGDLQTAKDYLTQIQDSLPGNANLDKIQSAIDGFSYKAGGKLPNLLGSGSGSFRSILGTLPGASQNLDLQTYSAKTQAGADYVAFADLTRGGITEKQAFDIASQAIGADRMKAAYKAMTGKDWAG